MNNYDVGAAQAPLRKSYLSDPRLAQVVDSARAMHADISNPFNSQVEPMPGCGVTLPVGVHRALGGPHDAPTPGDILCAALAACQESAIRMVANLLGITLESLSVTVTADVDVRGALMVDRVVPVGFQAMQCAVQMRVKADTRPDLVRRLKAHAERSCVVLQTLQHPPPIELRFNLE